jgi:hypothetical protein
VGAVVVSETGGDLKINNRLEAAKDHPLAIEGHFTHAHFFHAWIIHDLFVDAVAVLP